jgi:uracil phosphoribosyltransferase
MRPSSPEGACISHSVCNNSIACKSCHFNRNLFQKKCEFYFDNRWFCRESLAIFNKKTAVMIFNLSDHNSIANDFLFELRDTKTQRDQLRFRKNMERLGEIMAYEISKTLPFQSATAVTPLGSKNINVLQEQPVLVTILRAGLPYFQGFLNFFDRAEAGFIGAYRKEGDNHITIKLEYLATTSLAKRTVILIDPMLATGRSVVDAVNAMMRNGMPNQLHIVSLVSAPDGIEFLTQNIKAPFSLWTCAVDEKLNDRFYIVPGLGDAGDLSFGEKL